MSFYELGFALYDLSQTVMNSEHWPCFAPCPFLQLDSVAGVPAGSAAVQLQEEVGE